MLRVFVVLAAILLAAPMAAQAVINVTVERVSDTQAIFTFAGATPEEVGVFDPNSPSQRGGRMYWFSIFEGGVFPTAPLTISNNSVVITHLAESDTIGTTIDGAAITCTTPGMTNPMRMYTTGSNKAAGDTITGTATLDVVGTTWAAVGTSGDIWYGSDGNARATTKTGTWTMIESVPPPPAYHMGDANKDGSVDLQDFGILKENFGIEIGTTGTWEMADFNGDKGIDLQDFGILKDHFGHTTGSVPVTAVPEPATMSLLALAGLGLLRRRR